MAGASAVHSPIRHSDFELRSRSGCVLAFLVDGEGLEPPTLSV